MAVLGTRKLTPEQEDAICERYARGERTGVLAASLSASAWTIRETLARRGVARIACGGTWRRHGVPFREDYFSKIDTHDKAYWLGFLHADGHVSTQNQVRLSLGTVADAPHVGCFLRAIGLSRRPLSYEYPHLRRNWFIGVVGSARMSADLNALGVVTNARVWPILDPVYEGSFCLGLFDGDGSWMRDARCRITASFVAAPAYAADFADAVERGTGLRATPKPYHPKVSYVRYANQDAVGTLASWLYAHCETFLPRKRQRVERWIGTGAHQCPV